MLYCNLLKTRQVKLVGCIVELEDASTNTEYTIEDTTGRLKVISATMASLAVCTLHTAHNAMLCSCCFSKQIVVVVAVVVVVSQVKIFHSDGEGQNDRSAERRARNEVGTYVRVFGSVSPSSLYLYFSLSEVFVLARRNGRTLDAPDTRYPGSCWG